MCFKKKVAFPIVCYLVFLSLFLFVVLEPLLFTILFWPYILFVVITLPVNIICAFVNYKNEITIYIIENNSKEKSLKTLSNILKNEHENCDRNDIFRVIGKYQNVSLDDTYDLFFERYQRIKFWRSKKGKNIFNLLASIPFFINILIVLYTIVEHQNVLYPHIDYVGVIKYSLLLLFIHLVSILLVFRSSGGKRVYATLMMLFMLPNFFISDVKFPLYSRTNDINNYKKYDNIKQPVFFPKSLDNLEIVHFEYSQIESLVTSSVTQIYLEVKINVDIFDDYIDDYKNNASFGTMHYGIFAYDNVYEEIVLKDYYEGYSRDTLKVEKIIYSKIKCTIIFVYINQSSGIFYRERKLVYFERFDIDRHRYLPE